MAIKSNAQLSLNDVSIGFLNFEGRTDQYNKDGGRGFVIFLNEGLARRMADDGFNVKWPKPKDDIDPEDDRRNPYLSVTVSNDHKDVNPSVRVFLVDGPDAEPERIGNDNLAIIDTLDISHANVIINPYVWDVNGQQGVKAYLKAIQIYLNNYDFTPNYGADDSDLPF